MGTVIVSDKPQPAEFYPITIEKDGIQVGHATLYVIKDFAGTRQHAYVNDVYVNEDCRMSGYGKMLMDAARDLAKQLGCYKIVLCSRLKNHSAQIFYIKLGYEFWGYELRMNLTETAE